MLVMPGALWGTNSLTLVGNTRLKTQNTINYVGEIVLTNSAKLFTRVHEPVSSRLSQVCTNGLVFHMDASELGTLTLDGDEVTVWSESSARQNICAWDGTTPITATPAGVTRPKLLRGELNGLPVVDLGEPVDDGGMAWSRAVEDIKTFIIVVGSQQGGGTLLGCNGNLPGYCFRRGCDLIASKGDARPANSPVFTSPITRNHAMFANQSLFSTRINGFPVNEVMSAPLSGGYDIVTVRMKASDAAASAFARIAGGGFNRAGAEGGQRIAEVLAYNIQLSDWYCERVERYLMKKWFGRVYPGYGGAYAERICEATDHNANQNGLPFNISGDNTVDNVMQRHIHVSAFRQVNKCEYFTVENETLDFDRADWAKKIRLMSNSRVEMTARRLSTTCPVPGAALHVAADGTVETDGAGNVLRMEGVDGAGCAMTNRWGAGSKPRLVANALNGRPVVDFGANGSGQHLVWQTNLVVRAAFLVMKVSNPKCTFLGSVCPEMNVVDHFTRYDQSVNLIYSQAGVQPGARSGICRINDERVVDWTKKELPSDSFVVFGQTFDGAQVANAFGCGALQPGNLRAERTGGFQLAEAIVYDRPLTDSESLDVQAYLRYKWLGERMTGYALPGESYSIPGLGAGQPSSVEIRGTAPVSVGTLFGGQNLTLTAPDCVVTVPAPQGTLALSNACLATTASIPAGKVIAAPGTTNTLAAGTGSFASFTVTGALAVKGDTSPTITALTFNANTELQLGTGTLEAHTLALGENVAVSSTVAADGACGSASACDLSVAGGGSVALTLDPSRVEDPCGLYPVLTYGSLPAADAARLARWSVSVVPDVSASHSVRLRVVNNSLSVSIAKTGVTILIR